MKPRFFLLAACAVVLLTIASYGEDDSNLTACYQVTLAKKPVVFSGKDLRQMVQTASAAGAAIDSLPNAKPDAKKCSNSNAKRLNQAPDLKAANSAYYGQADSPAKFRSLAELPCGTAAPQPHQFFAIGDMIFYRYCGGNDENGYVYFWGMQEGKSSACFNANYPEMYQAVVKGRPKLTIKDLRLAETKGNVGAADLGGQALAAEVAAELIAEAYRDYLLKYLNYMLLDIEESENAKVKDKDKVSTAAILAGNCPPNVGKDNCQNKNTSVYGVHPLAWGGAQKRMTANNAWGHENGANSDFGKNYEAGLIERWLVATQNGKLAPAGTACTVPLENRTSDRTAFRKFLNDSFYK